MKRYRIGKKKANHLFYKGLLLGFMIGSGFTALTTVILYVLDGYVVH